MIRIIEKTQLKQEKKSALGVGEIKQPPKYKCLVCDENDTSDTWSEVLTEEHVEVVEMLNKLSKQLKIYPAMMDEIWQKICNFSEAKYKLGLKDCNEKWRNS